jgi:acetyltransferase-like isoleucine patch superfamily enzyme
MRRTFFMAWYRLKIRLFQFIVGEAAIEIVLYNSWFPRFVLEIGGATIGKGTRVYRWLSVHESQGSFKNLVIGENVHIGKFVLLDLTAPLTIGNRVGIGMFSKVLSHQNLGNTHLSERYPRSSGPMTIPDDVVIGASSMLLYPTRLAPGTLVAAGAVVRGEYEAPCLLMGNPARVNALLSPKS